MEEKREQEDNFNIDQLRDSSRKVPANTEVEQSILGAMLLEEKAVPKAFEILRPEYFFDKRNRLIFAAMQSLYELNEPIETIAIYEELKKGGKLDAVGGPAYIARLSQDITSAVHIDYHARLILEKWILRKLINTSLEIASSAYEAKEDVFDLLDKAEERIFQISEESLKESFKPMDKAVREALELIEAIHANKMDDFSVPTGLYALDDMLGGFQKSDLIIIAARPSMGKTAFALSIARNAAIDHKVPVAVFSLEMSTIQLVTRLISAEARIDAHSIRTGRFKAEEGAKISRTVHKLSDAPIYLDDTPGQTVLEVRAKARRLKADKNVGMVIIDYLQLMTSSSRMESREREISTISRSLKALAKELNIPVLALSQLNRAVESTSDKRPMLSHLRESGSIEQDADVVLFLYRPEVYGIKSYLNDNMPTEGTGEVIIGKQRNGPVGDVRVKFIKEYARYENLDMTYGNMAESASSNQGQDEVPI